ncbi:pyrroline-5-carboxylate reductase [uncultured Faecalibaculum sp.]|uniref:pyrroline-5-carboxylate reductase n=1 Tax=uncultured Faecalibaculum sp. TaxID=1729681 RepID=UPI00272BBA38|nr:pyrroline-5-carboxylate reductase [uncultured Faecalibaculum sp.]
MKLSFIGFGNMAQSMARGLIDFHCLPAEDIYASAAHFDKLQQTAGQLNIHACPDNLEAAAAGDVIILAVKPYMIEEVAQEIRSALVNKIVVCIAAGFNEKKLRPLLPDGCESLCVMPNTPIRVGKGIMVWETANSLTPDSQAKLAGLFGPIALIAPVDSAHMDIAGTIAGCSPAFAAMFIEALSDAGVKHGLQRAQALEMAACVLQGTGALFMADRSHPGVMKDSVCSPGGTTIRGVSQLEKDGFRGDIIDAVDAIMGGR